MAILGQFWGQYTYHQSMEFWGQFWGRTILAILGTILGTQFWGQYTY